MTVVVAGSETVAHASYTGMFFALSNPSILSKLKREIDEAWPDSKQDVSFQALEQLPYLVCISILPQYIIGY
jgi:cytochrome P450